MMRQPFFVLAIASLLFGGSIAPVSAQAFDSIDCDPRSGCTYPMETPIPGEAETRSRPKRKPAPARVVARAAPVTAPLVLEQVAAAPPTAEPTPQPAQAEPAAAFEPVIPVALALSLNFAPPPLPEPRFSPTTCLLERAFSDVHVADPEDTALKPRLFERGVKLLASKIGTAGNEAADQTH